MAKDSLETHVKELLAGYVPNLDGKRHSSDDKGTPADTGKLLGSQPTPTEPGGDLKEAGYGDWRLEASAGSQGPATVPVMRYAEHETLNPRVNMDKTADFPSTHTRKELAWATMREVKPHPHGGSHIACIEVDLAITFGS